MHLVGGTVHRVQFSVSKLGAKEWICNIPPTRNVEVFGWWVLCMHSCCLVNCLLYRVPAPRSDAPVASPSNFCSCDHHFYCGQPHGYP